MKKNEIITVENAKVEQITYRWYSRNSGYISNGDGIVFVTVDSVTFDLKKQVVTTVMLDSQGKEYVREGEFKMFRTPEDFENNSVISSNNTATTNIIGKIEGLQDCSFDNIVEDDKSYVCARVWCFENGEPVLTPVAVNVIRNDKDGNGWKIIDGHLPENFWRTREEAIRYNEFKVVDEDGEVFIEQGIQKRLALTAKQQEIVDKISKLFKQAYDANIKFAWDRSYGGYLQALNGEQVYDFGYDANKDVIPGDEMPLNELCFTNTNICFSDYCSDEDEYIVCMKPTARQEKAWKKTH